MTREEKFNWIKQELKWTCNEEGKVFNKLGRQIGTPSQKGYIVLYFAINKVRYSIYAHQYVWFYFYNESPIVIDHINFDRTDNRLHNLRSVTYQQNSYNRQNTKGYYLCKKTGRWRSMITLNGKRRHIGRYKTEEEARIAYLTEKNKLHTYEKPNTSNSTN